MVKEIEDNFPYLPLGCSIILEKRARQVILDNISAAIGLNRNQILQKIQNFQHQTTLPFSLKNFFDFYSIPIQSVYKRGSWSRLCFEAGRLPQLEGTNEKELVSAISRKWLACNSLSYLKFILHLAQRGFTLEKPAPNPLEAKMLLMLYYDVWQHAGSFPTLTDSIQAIGQNTVLTSEIIEVLELLIDQIAHKELPILLPFAQPLKMHSRYTRDQILAAFGLSTFDKKSSSREGVVSNKELNFELLFINLIKSEENFSPTTMYDDYAISETLFHWQSQNSAGPETAKGLSYINHKKEGKRILLFLREKNRDEFGNTMGYVFIGEGILQSHYGAKPMNIVWELKEALPNYLWKEAAKLRVG